MLVRCAFNIIANVYWKMLLTLLCIICGIYAWEWLLLKSLDIDAPVTLFTLFYVLKEGFVIPVILTGSYLALPILALSFYRAGRHYRVISYYLLWNMIGVTVALSLALALFSDWQHINVSIYPWNAINLFYELDQRSILFQRWCWCFGICIFPVIVFNFLGQLTRMLKIEKALGDAHFATVGEMKKAGLFQQQGLVLGVYHGQPIRKDGFESALISAPSGSGKSAGVVIPNLIEFTEGSIVATDLKGELYRLTANYREKILGNAVYQLKFMLNDTDKEKHEHQPGHLAQYNPFYYVRKDEAHFNHDVLIIAKAWYPDPLSGEHFWAQTSRMLLLSVARYLWEVEGEVTLSKIYDMAHQKNFFLAILEKIQAHSSEKSLLTEELKEAFSKFLSYEEKTRQNILTSFQSKMEFLMIPSVREQTSSNNFDLRLLRQKKMSIYLTMTESDLELLGPLLAIFWAQLTNCMTQEEPSLTKEPYSVLCLLDEFGLQPRVDLIKRAISFFRSYRLRFIIVVQYHGQLVENYGHEGAKAFDNIKTRLIFTPTSYEDAEKISRALGSRAVRVTSKAINSGSIQREGQVTHSQNYQSKPLMRADELLRMHEDTMIILMQGQPPIKIKKAYWFKYNKYKNLLRAAYPTIS